MGWSALAQRDGGLTFVKGHPLPANLERDQRFVAFLKKWACSAERQNNKGVVDSERIFENPAAKNPHVCERRTTEVKRRAPFEGALRWFGIARLQLLNTRDNLDSLCCETAGHRLGYFLLPIALRNLVPSSRAVQPYLGKEILVPIATEDQFGLICSGKIFRCVANDRHARTSIRGFQQQYFIVAIANGSDGVCAGWIGLTPNRKVERNVRTHTDGLCCRRPRYQEQAQQADETDGLPFHSSSSGSRMIEVAHPSFRAFPPLLYR